MNWEIVAKCFGGLLLLVCGYAYLSDKSYTQEKIQVLEKRIDAIETKTASRK